MDGLYGIKIMTLKGVGEFQSSDWTSFPFSNEDNTSHVREHTLMEHTLTIQSNPHTPWFYPKELKPAHGYLQQLYS